MSWIDTFSGVWHYVVAGFTALVTLVASGHALLYKRDTRATVLWVGCIWLAPLIGACLYFILGVNRIKRQAVLLRGDLKPYRARHSVTPCLPQELQDQLPGHVQHLSTLSEVLEKVVKRPLFPGNRLDPLINGDQAFPAMLKAIEEAGRSITLSTYIFDRDETGLAFARALGAAVERGVKVRVLIDATGTRYSWPPILRELRRAKVRYARFLPGLWPWRLLSINLRLHRKILVIDGQTGFTGGMNIRNGHWLARGPRHPVRDIHFRVEGPVVAQLQEIFADDWFFTTRECLRGEDWFPTLKRRGTALVRAIPDGPDEDLDKMRWTILEGLSVARRTVKILTPYFLPDQSIIAALNLAAMRGVAVDIVLPSRNNLPFVHWASVAHWWQVLEHGCRIWLTPPPFDHGKLFLVDGGWGLVGSTNWDPRSLRLNFEFNLECYDVDLVGQMEAIFDERLKQARSITTEEVNGRSLPIQLRDGVARLLTPFL